MKYVGPLYGKIGRKCFDTGKTSADWDAMEERISRLEYLSDFWERQCAAASEKAVKIQRELNETVPKHSERISDSARERELVAMQGEMSRIAEICDNSPEQRYDDRFSLNVARQNDLALNEIRKIAGQFI